MKTETRINRNFYILFFITFIITLDGLMLYGNREGVELHGGDPLLIFIVSNTLFGIFAPIIILGYRSMRDEDIKIIIQKELKQQIPDADKLFKMDCIMCNGKIDQPMNLIKHLGIDQTKQYLDFCEETHTTPSLYCCGCYAMVKRQPNWQKAMDDMINQAIKYGEYKKLYEDKLKMIS